MDIAASAVMYAAKQADVAAATHAKAEKAAAVVVAAKQAEQRATAKQEVAVTALTCSQAAAVAANLEKNAALWALQLATDELDSAKAAICSADDVVKRADAETNPAKKAKMGSAKRQPVKDIKQSTRRLKLAIVAHQAAQRNLSAFAETTDSTKRVRHLPRHMTTQNDTITRTPRC